MPNNQNPFLLTARETFLNLPAVFILYTALHLLHSTLAWLDPPRYGWIWTIIFPFIFVFAFLWVRLYREGGIPNPNGVFYTFWTLVLAAVAAILVTTAPAGLSLDQIIRQHEHTTYFWVVLLMLHCVVTRGMTGFLAFFGVGVLYGGLLESSGIQLGFFFEPNYHLYAPEILRPIFRAPVTTILGWTTVFYPTVFVTEKILGAFNVKNLIVRAFHASLVGLFIDLQVDPVASEVGLWNWNKALEPGFLGVPTLNFVSWFFAVPPFAFAVMTVFGKHDWSPKKKLGVLLVCVPICQIIAGILTFTTMFLIEGADSPALKLLFAGIKAQLGMG
jgi:carotenoid biosynthesis protein